MWVGKQGLVGQEGHSLWFRGRGVGAGQFEWTAFEFGGGSHWESFVLPCSLNILFCFFIFLL